MDRGDLRARAAFAPDELGFNGHLDLVKAVLRDLAARRPGRGLDLTLATDAPPGSGLGSSSALVVAMLAAVWASTGRRWDPAELARTAYQVERIDLKIEGGMQDQYAAAYGGLNFIEFAGDDQVEVHPLPVATEVLEALERSLVLAWSGDSRTDDGILRRQVDGVLLGSERSLASLSGLKALAEAMRDALLAGDLATFAEGLRQGWEHKRRLATGIATPRLEELYEVGRAAGAAGGKVLGAGGGGFMLLFVRPEHRPRVLAALARRERPPPHRRHPGGGHARLAAARLAEPHREVQLDGLEAGDDGAALQEGRHRDLADAAGVGKGARDSER